MQARRLTQLIVICICFILVNVESIAQEQVSKSRLVEITVSAPALKGNLLGDPTEQSAIVYLPPSHDSNSAQRFPTLYLLHGFLGRNRAWTNGIFQGLNIQLTMDEMIKSGKIREMIIVAPNGRNAYGGAFYTNSSVTGNWEDHMVRDLVIHIDSNYRTIARSESRGIAGHSMGGFGAIVLE